jgi:uncharacterized membrane protein YhaH (DUF805 family)
MLVLAAATTTVDRLRDIPTEFWWKLLLAIAAFVAFIIFLRKVAKMNKVVLTVVSVLFLTIFGFNWIYERNEPAWATPVVAWLGGFFPSKGPPPKPATPPPTTPPAGKKN